MRAGLYELIRSRMKTCKAILIVSFIPRLFRYRFRNERDNGFVNLQLFVRVCYFCRWITHETPWNRFVLVFGITVAALDQRANKEKGSMDERWRKRRRIGVRLTARERWEERRGRENDRSTRSATCLFRGPYRGLVKPVCTRRRVADTPSFTWIIRDTRYIAAKSRTHFPNQRAFASL